MLQLNLKHFKFVFNYKKSSNIHLKNKLIGFAFGDQSSKPFYSLALQDLASPCSALPTRSIRRAKTLTTMDTAITEDNINVSPDRKAIYIQKVKHR